jgi:RNA-directed DNA polymerase
MPKFVKPWRLSGCDEAFRAHVVAYADDFVTCCRGHAAEPLTWKKAVMTKLGLTLNEDKTSLRDARQERFSYRGNGQWYWGASPSKKSVQRLKTKVRKLLVPGNNAPWQEVRDKLNRSLRGWSNYFYHGTRRPAFCGVDFYVRERVRPFLVRRHKVAGRGKHQFSFDVLHGERGVPSQLGL